MLHLHKQHLHERTILVGVETLDDSQWDIQDSLNELEELTKTAGGEVIKRFIQKLKRVTSSCYIGTGKAEELGVYVKENKINTAIFDDELSPAQARNLEKVLNIKVLDRTQLILDIFAQRAQTKEAKIQIELAQMQYLLPRLTRMWTHLSRQAGGGVGLRGPGETQLEVDRRRAQERVDRLKKDLVDVRRHRATERSGRKRQPWPTCSLVGYTNAGKSTLMNRLTESEVYVADQLFATLDPTIRNFSLPNKQKVLLSDTVGFIQKLPHDLVDSFKATLEEVVEADVLIHVVDCSHPLYLDQIKAVDEVLKQIEAHHKQIFLVFNKIDKADNAAFVKKLTQQYSPSVALSAKTGEGMDQFYHELEKLLQSWRQEVKLRIPQSEGALLNMLYSSGHVSEKSYEGNDVVLKAFIPQSLESKVTRFAIKEKNENTRTPRRRKTT